VPFDVLAEAKLILTDELIREALRRDKELRRAAEGGDAEDDAEDDTGETTEKPN
jgi:ribosome maturation factor RimP